MDRRLRQRSGTAHAWRDLGCFLLALRGKRGRGHPGDGRRLGGRRRNGRRRNHRTGWLGCQRGTPASEAGLIAPGGGGTAATDGGLGTVTPGPETGADGATATGGAPTAGGGVGANGNTAGIEGGFGATGGVTVCPATGATPGGLGSGGIGGGTTDADWAAVEPGGFCTGLGGRFIIAVSRGLDDNGWPSRRGGRTMRTVSFLGSDI